MNLKRNFPYLWSTTSSIATFNKERREILLSSPTSTFIYKMLHFPSASQIPGQCTETITKITHTNPQQKGCYLQYGTTNQKATKAKRQIVVTPATPQAYIQMSTYSIFKKGVHRAEELKNPIAHLPDYLKSPCMSHIKYH